MAKTGVEYLQSCTKRRLDVFGASLIGIALSPVAAVAATGAAIDTRDTNPFFLQERYGQDGRPFQAIKFRTLRQRLVHGPAQEFGTFDPRATKFGLFLRRSGLDELPQLVNVMRGDMSLVGLRPATPTNLETFEQADPSLFSEWHECYTSGRPGILSTSAIYRHGVTDMTPSACRESMRMDIIDVGQASLGRDIRLLAAAPRELFIANQQAGQNSGCQNL